MSKRALVFCASFLAGFTLAMLLALPAFADEQWELSAEPLGVQLCMTCHGAYGQGSAVVGGPNLAGMEPWYLQRQLELFRAGARGYEKDYVPAFEMRKTAEVLSDTDIAGLVATIGAWPVVAVEATIMDAAALANAAEVLQGDTAVGATAVAGATLYQPCAACHGMNAEGNAALGAPALRNRNDWYLLKQLKLYKSGWRGAHPQDGPGAQMRAMMATLATEADMQAVVAYIGTLGFASGTPVKTPDEDMQ